MMLDSRPVPEYPEYNGLLQEARATCRADGHFVDPAKLVFGKPTTGSAPRDNGDNG